MCLLLGLLLLSGSVAAVSTAGARGQETGACPLHCSLNGHCDPPTGTCTCAAGWAGSDCRALALLPLAVPADQAYCHYNDSTWGGSVIRGDDGTYHLFFSEMSNNCSLHAYGSDIILFFHGSQLCHPARTACCALLSAHAYGVSIANCDPMYA